MRFDLLVPYRYLCPRRTARRMGRDVPQIVAALQKGWSKLTRRVRKRYSSTIADRIARVDDKVEKRVLEGGPRHLR